MESVCITDLSYEKYIDSKPFLLNLREKSPLSAFTVFIPFSVNIYFKCNEINMIGPQFPESWIFVKNICALALNKLQKKKMVLLESANEDGFVCLFLRHSVHSIQMFQSKET